MKHGLTHIDHPVIGVRDMEAARATYERLGFIVPPRGAHPAWGTGNWCIQFANDYLELRGIIDAPKAAREAHGLAEFLAKQEGLMGVAFGTTGADASYASLVSAGLHPRAVKPLTRDFELPEGTLPVSFKLCFVEANEVPGLMLVVICEHLTPERLRRPEWLLHPNGATGVLGLAGIVRDVEAAARAHARVFDRVTHTTTGLEIELSNGGRISLLTERKFALQADAPRFTPPLVAPALGQLSIATQNLEQTASYFAAAGIQVRRTSNSIRVAPSDACGVALEFVSGQAV